MLIHESSITNENTVEALGNINPRFLLNSRGKKALDDGPNLWSFARAAKSTPNCGYTPSFIYLDRY